MSDVRPLPSTRRAATDRLIVSLQPMFDVISARTQRLRLGEPRITSGPMVMRREHFDFGTGGDRVRKGAVWFINGQNTGFHVDFFPQGLCIEAWQGRERHVKVSIAGKVTEDLLGKELALVFAAAGLTDLARTDEVRAQLFTATKARP